MFQPGQSEFLVLAINFVQLAIVMIVSYTWEEWMSYSGAFHLSNYVDSSSGGLIAYFIVTFIFHLWNRWRHKIDYLWTHFHQIYHSPQRLEVITSFYKHPIEMTADSIIRSFLVYAFLGLSMEEGAIYTLCTALGEFFYHTNVKTPQWIGYIFQHPEMRRIHHEYEKHTNNYGDIVWWDMLFGSYGNRKEFNRTSGFGTEKNCDLKTCLNLRLYIKKRIGLFHVEQNHVLRLLNRIQKTL
jgi:sterol desaturase/sphingolipid hydroxylase (fatty acid hydroxylase superfamily)